MGFSDYFRRKRLDNYILEIAIFVKEVEEVNSSIVKRKIILYRKRIIDDNEFIKLKKGVDWQKKAFEQLSDCSYILEKYLKKEFNDPIIVPLKERIIEARGLIDRFVSVFNLQSAIIRSFSPIEDKKNGLRPLIKDELRLYKIYKELSKRIPVESLANLEVEYEDKHLGTAGIRADNRIVIPLLSTLMLGVLYLLVDDEEFRAKIRHPEFIAYTALTSYILNMVLKSLKKIIKGRRLK